jgi:hypothetical protein
MSDMPKTPLASRWAKSYHRIKCPFSAGCGRAGWRFLQPRQRSLLLLASWWLWLVGILIFQERGSGQNFSVELQVIYLVTNLCYHFSFVFIFQNSKADFFKGGRRAYEHLLDLKVAKVAKRPVEWDTRQKTCCCCTTTYCSRFKQEKSLKSQLDININSIH